MTELSFAVLYQYVWFASPAEPSGEPLSSDDFEMINNEVPSESAEHDGESFSMIFRDV